MYTKIEWKNEEKNLIFTFNIIIFIIYLISSNIE